MSNSPHRIRRLRYLVSTSSQTEAFAIRQNLRASWQDTLMPAFERAFDEIASRDRVIHIPKLELHLKVTSEQELMEVLPDLIQQQLKEQLQSIFQQNFPGNGKAIYWQESTTQQNQLEILLHYLSTGSLPWQVAQRSGSEIAVELKETSRQQLPQILDYLRSKHEQITFYFRWIQLIPEEELLTLIRLIFDNISHAWRTELLQFITLLLDSQPRIFSRYTQLQLIAALLSESLRIGESNINPDFTVITESILSSQEQNKLNDFIASLPPSIGRLFPQPKRTSRKSAADLPNSSITEINEVREEILSNQEETLHFARSNLNDDGQLSDDSPDIPISEINDRVETNRLFDNEVAPSNIDIDLSIFQRELWQTSFPLPSTTEDELPLAVKYAGLVLIHPFITRLFENTGVKETGNKELSSSEITRAAALLHFLAIGGEELYEYELSFIKILLGFHPEMPLLVAEGMLKPEDKEEAEALLQSVITYWTILKNTSIHGLRSSFLQRQGLLREVEDGWKLQIEPQSFDMLLNQLPWSISIIKLPWLKKPIYTEWQIP